MHSNNALADLMVVFAVGLGALLALYPTTPDSLEVSPISLAAKPATANRTPSATIRPPASLSALAVPASTTPEMHSLGLTGAKLPPVLPVLQTPATTIGLAAGPMRSASQVGNATTFGTGATQNPNTLGFPGTASTPQTPYTPHTPNGYKALDMPAKQVSKATAVVLAPTRSQPSPTRSQLSPTQVVAKPKTTVVVPQPKTKTTVVVSVPPKAQTPTPVLTSRDMMLLTAKVSKLEGDLMGMRGELSRSQAEARDLRLKLLNAPTPAKAPTAFLSNVLSDGATPVLSGLPVSKRENEKGVSTVKQDLLDVSKHISGN